MPELPEIEHLKRSLQPLLIGATVCRVRVARADVIRRAADGPSRSGCTRRPRSSALLGSSTIVRLARHGKQLAIIADSGAVICVHLGMSGQLRHCPADQPTPHTKHDHVRWTLHRDGERSTLLFRDPRRFGGIWAARSLQELQQRCWSMLGRDALSITPGQLHDVLSRTKRGIKAALLDQRVVAGVGNIYADECLFESGIDPRCAAASLSLPAVQRLHTAMTRTLRNAIKQGGSTVRDYVDGRGDAGTFARKHKVYGRGGRRCTRCGGELVSLLVAQRSTVYCPQCQQ